jgi:ribonuclease P protein component
MKKYEVVKEHKEFNDIINNSKYIKNNNFVIYYRNSEFNYPRFGIAISKKFGKAHIRNYYKRITRNIIDINKKSFKNNMDYIIMIKKNSSLSKYNDLKDSFENLLKELN